jgi:hypothetical protein
VYLERTRGCHTNHLDDRSERLGVSDQRVENQVTPLSARPIPHRVRILFSCLG